jgi:hypothetical protein
MILLFLPRFKAYGDEFDSDSDIADGWVSVCACCNQCKAGERRATMSSQAKRKMSAFSFLGQEAVFHLCIDGASK